MKNFCSIFWGWPAIVSQIFALGISIVLLNCDSAPPANPCGTCNDGQYCCLLDLQCKQIEYVCTNNIACNPGFEQKYPPGVQAMDPETCTAIPQECICAEAAPLEPGMWGRYSALINSPTGLWASAYENKFGDLIFINAQYDNITVINKEVVDGIPDVPPTGGPSGWRKGISSAGEDVGLYTDIVVGTNNTPMISYHDSSNSSLKFAVKSGDIWTIHTLDLPTANTKETVGLYTSANLFNNKPALAYLVLNIRNTDGSFSSELRGAISKKEIPTDKTDWVIDVIDSGAMPCRNLCESQEACFLNSNSTSQCKTKGNGCSNCANDTACLNGVCQPILPDIAYLDVPLAVGLWPKSLVVNNKPVVVFHDAIAGTLKVATTNAGNWNSAVVAGSPSDPVGAFCSATSDSSGIVHAAYQHIAQSTLHYIRINPVSLTGTTSETIDNGQRSDGKHPVGADSSIVIDSSNLVRVVYQDQQNADLLTALRTGPGQWTPNDSADPNLGRLLKGNEKGYGFYSDLVLQNSQIYGSTFFFDPQNDPSGMLEFFVVP